MTSLPDEQPLGSPFIKPVDDTPAPSIELPATTLPTLTIEDVLSQAKLPERTATVCLRPDLQADYDTALVELGQLVDARGELLEDPEASLDDQSRIARARDLSDSIDRIRREMTAHLWRVRFRGMPSEDFAVFNKQHMPKGEGTDMSDYNLRLIAATAITPAITYDQAKALNGKLGGRAMAELANAAWNVCNEGGISVPKSPGFLRNLAQG